MIFCSFLMDAMIGILFGHWCIHGQSMRMPLAFGVFYILRHMFMMVYSVQPYEGYYWQYPGFPSFMIAYGETNDFFYSGHVGACILAFHEFTKQGWSKLRWFCIFTMVCQFSLMLITRGHFFIDLVSGILFADYIYKEVDKFMEGR